jgi:class 3 adenylate cyclase
MDIAVWLRDLGLGQFEEAFRKAEIDFEILRDLHEEDLKQLGLPLGHRKRLLRAIAEVRSHGNVKAPSTSPRTNPDSGAERRQLTVMFCDLVGSTGLSTRLDPEDLSELIRSYQHVVAAVIGRFDGNVANLMGDGALVYFGYPSAHEDDAERAARAGLEVVGAVRALGKKIGIALEVRIGIATGIVVVGDLFGSGLAREQGVVGETPNLAARLQSIASPGKVVVSDSTRRLLGAAFELRALEPQVMKGFEAPVSAWTIVGEVENINRFDASRLGTMTRLVGREKEMACLADRWSLARQGNGQVVLLSGDAGIGKSRILAELRELLADQQLIMLRYQCSPHYVNTPLHPIVGQIKHAAGFAVGDSTGSKLEKLEKMVELSGLKAEQVVPFLADLLSIPLEGRYPPVRMAPAEIREKTISVLIALFLGLTNNAPVLAQFEDAHWVDPTTLDLFNRLIESLPHSSVLLVLTFRPEFTPRWTDPHHVTALTLGRFEYSEALELIERVTRGKAIPPELLNQIVTKTDGVPLFIEELTKTVLESGILKEVGGAYVLTTALAPLAIPSTLHDSLTARLDRLAPVRVVAQTGAAIGREFSYRLLEAVLPIRGEELVKALHQLMAAELIHGHGTPPESAYIFKHALVQDAAYASLLRSSRQRVHASIAHALTERLSDQIESSPEVVAHHYTEAGLIKPAVKHWLAASELALLRSANTEGARYAETGLALCGQLGEDPDRPEIELSLQVARANAALALKGYTAPDTVEILTLVKTILDTGIGTDIQRFSILYGLWAANYVAARIGVAHDLGNEYLDVAKRNGDATFLMIGQRIVGAGLIAAGRHREGLLSLRQAEQHYDPLRHRPLSYRFGQDIGLSVLCHEVWALWFLGQFRDAEDLTGRVIRELDGHGHATTVAFCTLYGIIFPYLFAGDLERVDRYAKELAEYCVSRKMGPHYVAAAQLCTAVSAGIKQPTAEIFKEIRAESEALHRFGVYVLDTPISAKIAEIYLTNGNTGAAESVLRDAIAFAEKSGEIYWLAELYRLKSRTALNHRKTSEARKDLRKACLIAQRQKAVPLELRTLIDMVKLLGKTDEAEIRLPILLSAIGPNCHSAEAIVGETILSELTQRASR